MSQGLVVYSTHMAQERVLDPSIFEKQTFKGEAEELFGEEGVITVSESGRFYSLNRGDGIDGVELVVLDTKSQTLLGYIFDDDKKFLQRANSVWEATKFSTDPRNSEIEGASEERLFEIVSDFVAKFKQDVSSVGGEEALKAESALKVAIKPLLSYFEEKRRDLDQKISTLSGI